MSTEEWECCSRWLTTLPHLLHSFSNGFEADKWQRQKLTCVESLMHILYWVHSRSILYRISLKPLVRLPMRKQRGSGTQWRRWQSQVKLTQKSRFCLCFSTSLNAQAKAMGESCFLDTFRTENSKKRGHFSQILQGLGRELKVITSNPLHLSLLSNFQGLAQCLAYNRHSMKENEEINIYVCRIISILPLSIILYALLTSIYYTINFIFMLNNKKL